jgi:mediator of RNA polymerase II transcription subunit 5
MEGRISASEALRDSIKYWSDFISKCLTKRLDAASFEDYVRLVFSKHQLPPEIIADFFVRPQKSNCVSPDPRIPPYISVLTQLRYIDAASILRALYRYSSLHAQIPQQAQQDEGGINGEGETKQDAKRPSPTRWKSSSWLEEVMFYHVIKLVVEGTAFKDSRTALELIHIISKWMSLFTTASNSMNADMLGGSMQDPQIRHEMETARAAFVPLLLRLVDNAALVKVISHPAAKGTRPALLTFPPSRNILPVLIIILLFSI